MSQKNDQSKNVQGGQSDLATAAAVKDAKDSKDAAPAAPAEGEKKYPERAYVRTATGDRMVHLLTGVEITGVEKKIELDHFAIAQIEAGKWVIVDTNA